MHDNEEPHMWTYWRDDKSSPKYALISQYPETLKTNPRLQDCLRNIEMWEREIDVEFERMAKEFPDTDDD